VEFGLPKTRAGWIALVAMLAVTVSFLYFFTSVFSGHAVELSVVNR
jgi:hypothetical protein